MINRMQVKNTTQVEIGARPISELSRIRGCMLGGAVGDALGAPVEFHSLDEIFERFGPGGIRDFVPLSGVIGAITDDTQMSLFTAEGLLRASVRFENRGICHPPSVIHHAYLRWFKTQGDEPESVRAKADMDGWLIGIPELWARRAPGTTCLTALRDSECFGGPSPARNNSKGCGTVMRTAPIGLIVHTDRVFEMAVETSELTHGHPTASLSAGFLSVMISSLVEAGALPVAIETAKQQLITRPEHAETLRSIELAQSLVKTGRRDAVTVEHLGGGWVADEALAIGLYAVLATSSFEDAVVLAVNHSGDSDSTGAIAGNIAGAFYGVEAIPTRWLETLELREEITTISDDLAGVRDGSLDLSTDDTWQRYPGS